MFGVDNQTSTRSTVLPEKVRVPQLEKKFPEIYGALRFTTVLTRTRQCTVS